MRKPLPILPVIATTIVLAASSSSAFATLGSNSASIETDRGAMQAAPAKQSSVANYTVYEFTLPSGTVIREHLSMTGVVFAVSWNGPFIPDLQQILGASHFATFTAAVREQTERGPQVVRQGSLVVRSFGRMRAFNGSAYLIDQLPSGVKPDEIQ